MIYASLRVSRGCLHAIQKYRDRLQVTVNANPERYQRFGPSMRVSIDDAVMFLLDQQRGHSIRVAKSRVKDVDGASTERYDHGEPMTTEEVGESKRSANHR